MPRKVESVLWSYLKTESITGCCADDYEEHGKSEYTDVRTQKETLCVLELSHTQGHEKIGCDIVANFKYFL